MRKILIHKRLLLGLAPVVAVGALVAAPSAALAAGPGPDPANWVTSENITGTSSDLQLEAPSLGITIDCTVSFSGSVDGGTSTDSIDDIAFTDCSATDSGGGVCPDVTVMADGLPWQTNATTDGAGNFFDTVAITGADVNFGTGTCIAAGLDGTVTGSPTGVWVNGSPNTFTFQSDSSASVTFTVPGLGAIPATLDGTFDVTGGTLTT